MGTSHVYDLATVRIFLNGRTDLNSIKLHVLTFVSCFAGHSPYGSQKGEIGRSIQSISHSVLLDVSLTCQFYFVFSGTRWPVRRG
jgi:hypothetical protein